MTRLRSELQRGKRMTKPERMTKAEARKRGTAGALGLAQQLRAKFPDLVSEAAEFRGEITVKVSDAERMPEICAFAQKELGFDYLVDISSVDNYGEDPRFTIIYHLYGYGHRCGLRLK